MIPVPAPAWKLTNYLTLATCALVLAASIVTGSVVLIVLASVGLSVTIPVAIWLWWYLPPTDGPIYRVEIEKVKARGYGKWAYALWEDDRQVAGALHKGHSYYGGMRGDTDWRIGACIEALSRRRDRILDRRLDAKAARMKREGAPRDDRVIDRRSRVGPVPLARLLHRLGRSVRR